MQYGTNIRTEYVAMMKKVGVELNEITEVPSRYDLQRFINGDVDVWNGYTINEPFVAEARGVAVHIIKPSDYGVDMYADCIIASEKTVREKPDLVRRFLKAVIQGWLYALSHREEAVKIVLEQDPRLNKDHEFRMLDESARLILARNARDLGIGCMNEAIWQKMLEELRSQSLLGTHPVVISEVYTNKFLPSGLDKNQTGRQ
jgi:ABC-type nitrate/sulfonate/bicarbonate transport system substrate-binding protein